MSRSCASTSCSSRSMGPSKTSSFTSRLPDPVEADAVAVPALGAAVCGDASIAIATSPSESIRPYVLPVLQCTALRQDFDVDLSGSERERRTVQVEQLRQRVWSGCEPAPGQRLAVVHQHRRELAVDVH